MSLLDSGNTGEEQVIISNDDDRRMQIENNDNIELILLELIKLNTYLQVITGEKL